jgi:hypothetical protein
LLAKAAEKHVEQAFGGCRVGREPHRAGEDDGGNEHAAPHALIGQLDTQRLPHATLKNGPDEPMSGAVDSNAGW